MNPFLHSDWIKSIHKWENKPAKTWERVAVWVLIILVVFLIIKGLIQ